MSHKIKSCHPEGRAFCAPKDLNVKSLQAFKINFLLPLHSWIAALDTNALAVDPHSNSLYHSLMFAIANIRSGQRLRLALAVLALFFCFPLALPAQTADDVINAYLKARGGVAKIKAVQTERITGTITFAPGVEGPFFVERKRPLKMHMEITVNGQSLIRVYDGKSAGWIYNPFVPNPSVTAMSAGDLAGIADEADFEGPFVDYKAKGNQLEYVDKEQIDGKIVHKLKLTTKQGDVSYFFFDASTGLVMKWQGVRKVNDKEIPWETYFRDFREADGLKYPFLVESAAADSDQIQKITATKIETNIPLDDSQFAKPKPPSPPAAAADPPKPN
jgi:outer membrane lipoprotein-sorting protein